MGLGTGAIPLWFLELSGEKKIAEESCAFPSELHSGWMRPIPRSLQTYHQQTNYEDYYWKESVYHD